MKKLYILLLILVVSNSSYAQEQVEVIDAFATAFQKGGERAESHQVNLLTSGKTEAELLEELENDLLPDFKEGFTTQMLNWNQYVLSQRGDVNFERYEFPINEVDHEIGEYLASNMREQVINIFNDELKKFLYEYMPASGSEVGRDTMVSRGAQQVMDQYILVFKEFIEQRKSQWVSTEKEVKTVKKQSDLDRAQKAYDQGDLKEAANIIATSNELQTDATYTLLYQIYDANYRKYKFTNRDKAKKSKKLRNQYKEWKPD